MPAMKNWMTQLVTQVSDAKLNCDSRRGCLDSTRSTKAEDGGGTGPANENQHKMIGRGCHPRLRQRKSGLNVLQYPPGTDLRGTMLVEVSNAADVHSSSILREDSPRPTSCSTWTHENLGLPVAEEGTT